MFLGKYSIDLNKNHVMGILNVTPDSFSDGNKDYLNVEKNIKKIKKMIREGASIIDIGPESTKPGSFPVEVNEQIKRCIPLIKQVKNQIKIPLSIDTSEPIVMEEAIKNGVSLVNDVRGLSIKGSSDIIKKYDVSVCISHIKGKPENMQENPIYKDIINDIYKYFVSKIKNLEDFGIRKDKIIIDPGFGFGKTLRNNIDLLNSLSFFKKISCPIMVGISRKSMVGNILNKKVNKRLYGSLAMETIAFLNGANIVRTHEVEASLDVANIINNINYLKK